MTCAQSTSGARTRFRRIGAALATVALSATVGLAGCGSPATSPAQPTATAGSSPAGTTGSGATGTGATGTGTAGTGTAPAATGSPTGTQPSRQPAAGPGPSSLTPVDAERAAVREEQLVGYATTLLAASAKKLSSQGRKQLRNLRDAHLAHAAELRGIAAGSGPSTPASPSASAAGGNSGLAAAAAQLTAAERKAATSYRRQALSASGEAAQLWGSLATFSAAATVQLKAARLGSAQPVPGALRVAKPRPRKHWTQLSEVAAQQALVTQLHAMVYGYQLATPQLAASRRNQGLSQLRQRRIFRDQLIAQLAREKAKVPAAAAAYVPAPRPVGPKTANAMLRGMESAMAPYVGIWLAAGSPASARNTALNQLGLTVGNIQRWGGSLPTWPGN